MKTYQDLLEMGEDDLLRANFCNVAVKEFKKSPEYALARDGDAYYSKHNTTIERFRKVLYTLSGQVKDDIFSANYKLKSLMFRNLVTQQVQYVLGNGLTLSEPDNKEKLGRDFDFKLQNVAKKAMAQGRAFGFWNDDHLEVFGYADTPTEAGFCPLYDEETAELRAGIRYWFKKVGRNNIMYAVLYEEDGYTEYRITNSKNVVVTTEKRAYNLIIRSTKAGGIESTVGENYGRLPIVPLYANDTYESELVGIRENIDCYDFVKSGFANQIDDFSSLYWILNNTGGMDDVDLARFVQRMKTVKAAMVDADQGVSAELHTVDVPVEARKTMLEILRKDIYEDFGALDVKSLSAAQKTTQEIQAAYQAQDNKCADFEYYVREFVEQILEIAGINDEMTFVWSKVVNQNEQTEMLLKAATYLDEETLIKHLPFLTPEEADMVVEARAGQVYEQFGLGKNEEDEDNEAV